MGIFSPLELKGKITIVGCGGIGSPTALALGKLGIPDLVLYDFDTIENHNLSNQLFPMDSIGKFKVETLKSFVESFTEAKIDARAEKINGGSWAKGIVVSAVDNMETRKQIFEGVKYNPACQLFLDGRIGGENVVLYTIKPCDPDDIALYEKTLYTDAEADDLPCTERAIIYVSFFIAGMIARAVAKFLKEGTTKREVIFDAKKLAIY